MAGSTYWAEGDTVLVFTPQRSFYIGTSVSVKVATSARSAEVWPCQAALSFTFTVSQRGARGGGSGGRSTKIQWTGGIASSSSPWATLSSTT